MLRTEMKKLVTEACGAALMTIGAFVLVATYFPLLNPTQYRLNSDGSESLVLRYVIGTAISLATLACSWKCNRHAKRARLQDGSQASLRNVDSDPQVRP